jgi:CRISPR-associated endonuclease/helicase Cas3
MLPSPHLILWAKLGNTTYPVSYHPLLFHLIDVGIVARCLWDNVLRQPMKERFASAVGLSVGDCGPWVAFWVGAHDIGKASPGFQQFRQSTKVLVKYLKGEGYDFTVSKPEHHATVSVPELARWLEDQKVPRVSAHRAALAVGGHHGVFPKPGWNNLGARVLGNDKWAAARRDLLFWLAHLLGVPRDRPMAGGQGNDQSYLMVLAGLTSVADWIGSDQALFPPVGDCKNYLDNQETRVRDYFAHAPQQADRALAQLGWIRRAEKLGQQPPFLELFKFLSLGSVRALQQAAATHAASLDGPALILVESPMGEGKTEAALCFADAWERRGGQGIYVALPTMATSNGMFGRLKQFLDATYPGRKNLHLLHGGALLSDTYNQLVQRAKEQTFEAELYDDDMAPGAVVADAWFAQDRKHGLLAPFAVGTIDQALLAVLQTRHGFVRLFGLAGKLVILDEVHAYDVYTTALMQRLLRWLGALGSPVVLLSATLPRKKRHELLEAYAGREVDLGNADTPYPRMTIIRPQESSPVAVEHLPATSRKTLAIAWHNDNLEQLGARLSETLQGGGCAVVIRNTVDLAQQTYRLLKKEGVLPSDIEVELFHARFLSGQRQEIEQRVMKRYGKDGPRPKKAILVATQVVEQSLDLDFDLIVTDFAPIDLLLQRAGRLWRHLRPRPVGLTEPSVWLLRPAMGEDGVPDFGLSQLVYKRFILLRSYLALENRIQDGRIAVTLPGEVEGLIESVYGDASLPVPQAPAWSQALAEAEKAMQAEWKDDRKAAERFLIAEPINENNILHEFNQQLEEDNPDVPKDRQAVTRLVERNIALVVLYRIDGKLYLDPKGKQGVSLTRRPNLQEAGELVSNAVTVNRKGCIFHYLKQAPPKAWQKSGLLQFHRVVQVNQDGVTLANEYPLTIDPELGVEFSRPEDQGA